MNIKITQVNAYEIEIDGVVHKGFEKKGEIEGLASFKNQSGQLVVVAKEPEDFFDVIFGGNNKSDEFQAVKMSPSLMPSKDKNESVNKASQ